MADTRGTFRLKNVRQDILNDEYVPIPDIWVGNNGFGYSSWAYKSKMSRTNINTGLAYLTDDLPTPSFNRTYKKASLSSTTNGYTCAQSPSYQSQVTKVVYSTGTFDATVPNRTASIYNSCTISANEKAYEFSGNWDGTDRSYTQKITFSNETWSQIPGSNVPAGFEELYSMGVNSGNGTGYGYGGPAPSYPSDTGAMYTAKIVFSNDTWSQLAASPWPRRSMGCGKLSTPTHSWYSGGNNSSNSNYTDRTDKLTFANDTWAISPTASLPRGMSQAATYPYNGEKGALVGGSNPIGEGQSSTAFTLTFATDTWDATSVAADSTMYGDENGWNAGFSAAENLGSTPGTEGFRRWFDGASDINATTPSTGYFIGGFTPSGDNWSANKINMTNDTLSHSPGVWDYSMKRAYSTGTREKAYFGGGGRSRVYKFTYSTETDSGTAMITGTSSDWAQAATGTQEVGYIGGGSDAPGSTQSGTSILRKMTFSTDTLDNSFGNITAAPNARFRWGAFGNQTMGYWFGGKNSSSFISHVSKVVYSTDTITADTMTNFGAVSPEPEGGGVSEVGHTSNDTHGYTIGGMNPTMIQYAYKLDFDSDTYTYLPSVNAPNGIYGQSATGNNDTGYWAGGWRASPNGLTSYVTKLNFSTDTQSVNYDVLTSSPGGVMFGGNSGASPRMRGLVPRQPSPLIQPEATPSSSTTLTGPQGIKNEGYLIQGIQGVTASPSGRSDVYRLDYNTDTWNSSVFANSTLTRKRGGATSTTTNAYIGGGGLGAADGNPTGGDMDKLTYATSTMSRIPGSDAGRVTTSRGIDGQPAAGNQTLGYWGGGYGNPGAGRSHIDKFVYSSETASSLPNYPWPQNNLGVAVAMQTHAYLGGGPADNGTNFIKITFSNDTYASKSGWTKSPGGPAEYRGATSSPTKAYIVGGLDLERRMDVTTWSNDTTSSSPSTFLQSPGFSYAPGQGGNEAGYFTGGGNVGNNGTTTEKITFATDTSAILPGAYFSSSSPSGINSYSTGGPNMNGVGTSVPNTI